MHDRHASRQYADRDRIWEMIQQQWRFAVHEQQLQHQWCINLLRFQIWCIQIMKSFVYWKCHWRNADNRLSASVCELSDYILFSYFTSRDDELQQINHTFSAFFDDLSARCIIHDMSKIEKTQLTLQYVILVSERNYYMYTFWVSAESIEKLTWNFFKLMNLLCLSERYESDHKIDHDISMTRRFNSCEEVTSHSEQCDSRDHHDDSWRDSFSTKQRR